MGEARRRALRLANERAAAYSRPIPFTTPFDPLPDLDPPYGEGVWEEDTSNYNPFEDEPSMDELYGDKTYDD